MSSIQSQKMVPEGCTIINYNLAECNNCALFFPKEEMFALLSFIDVGGQFCCV